MNYFFAYVNKQNTSCESQAAISGGHLAVVETASDILKSGGNAVDAAISAYLVACIAEPCMASLAAGLYAIYCPSNGPAVSLDAFCQTPIRKKSPDEIEFFPVEVDFGDQKELFYAGMGSVAVPAAVAGLFELHKKYGRMPLRELFGPAVLASRNGVPLSDFQYQDLILLAQIFQKDPKLESIFFNAGGIVRPGTLIRLPDLGDYLDFLSRSSEREFYEGEFATKLINLSDDKGGHLQKADLENVKPIWSRAKHTHFRGADIYTPGSGSFGSWLLNYWFESLDAFSHLGSNESLIQALQKTAQIKDRAIIDFHGLKEGGTSHFNILDKDGNGISLTFSIGEGSGRVVPETGIHLNNMLGESALLPNGFHSWPENSRMISMMTPVGLFHPKRKTKLLLGSGGAGRIPFMLAQVIQNWIEGDQHLNDIIMHPRCHFDGEHWQLEPGFDRSCIPHGSSINQWNRFSLYFGGVHAIMDHDSALEAMGDPRRDGVGILI